MMLCWIWLVPAAMVPPRTASIFISHLPFSIANGPFGSIWLSYKRSAEGEYPPELAAADDILQRYENELLKIPHVLRVSLDDSDHDIAIRVDVAGERDIPDVERQIPLRLDGYRVEVTHRGEAEWIY